MASTNVAEVAAGNRKAHLLLIAGRGLQVACKVVHHLRHQPRPVDGIDGADLVLALERQVGRDRLHQVLAIVEHSLNGDVVNVVVQQAEHLRLLEGAHAPVGAGHENANTFFAPHGVFRCTSSVAAGSAKNIELLAAARQLVLKEVAQQLHGHVFEGQCGAVGQGLQIQTVLQARQGHDGRRAKHFLGIGLAAQGA